MLKTTIFNNIFASVINKISAFNIVAKRNKSFDKQTIPTPEKKMTPSTMNPVLYTPAVTTNPVISKLFETISNQINSYNSNVETTPSTTPNAQPNPSTTPAEEVQAEPPDASNIVNEEQETVNC